MPWQDPRAESAFEAVNRTRVQCFGMPPLSRDEATEWLRQKLAADDAVEARLKRKPRAKRS